jgi:glutamate transport system permease protein
MSARQATVLYDVPGPRAVVRYRVYAVVFGLVVLGLLALVLRQMQQTGQFEYSKWEYFVTPKYVETILVDGVLNTLKAAVLAILLALAIGMLFGSGKLAERPWIRWPCWAFVEFFRAVPLLLLIIFVYFGYFSGTKIGGKEIFALVIGLALYNGAVLAEIVRAGVLALPAGQSEAAYAVGMTRGQVMRIVLLPQAVKIMIPAMISQFVVCLKDTSLGYAIGALGITVVFKQIWGEGRNQVQSIIVMAAIYILLNLAVTAIAHWAQRRYVGERTGAGEAADEAV